MKLTNLEELFLHELKDTYDAEKRMSKALPKMAKAASSDALKKAFEKHLAQTENQIERLEKIFEMLNKPARGKKCVGMTGLIEEGQELMSEDGSEAAIDAGLIGAAQKVEHYEIAAYGTLAVYADMLGLKQAENLLKQTLAEEKKTDEDLTQLAKKINFQAEHASEEDDEAKGNGKSRKGNGKFLGRMGQRLANLVGSR
jgi:ferritin-like metal-binding protein YciE